MWLYVSLNVLTFCKSHRRNLITGIKIIIMHGFCSLICIYRYTTNINRILHVNHSGPKNIYIYNSMFLSSIELYQFYIFFFTFLSIIKCCHLYVTQLFVHVDYNWKVYWLIKIYIQYLLFFLFLVKKINKIAFSVASI